MRKKRNELSIKHLCLNVIYTQIPKPQCIASFRLNLPRDSKIGIVCLLRIISWLCYWKNQTGLYYMIISVSVFGIEVSVCKREAFLNKNVYRREMLHETGLCYDKRD